MSEAECDMALNDASVAAMGGDWRRCAMAYRRALEGAPEAWECRYYCVSGYCSVLREGHFPASDDDLRFLRLVGKDVAAPPLHRAQACFTRGYLLWEAGDREAAARVYRNAVAAGESATPQDRDRTVTMPDASAGCHRPLAVGPILDQVVGDAADNLAVLEGRGASVPRAAAAWEPQTELGLNERRVRLFVPVGRLGTATHRAEARALLEMSGVGGAACDRCGKQAAEARLLRCQRCSRPWYCGKDCQTAAWASGHKQECRAKDEFEPLDIVKLKKVPPELQRQHLAGGGQWDLNATAVEVVGPAPATEKPSYDVRILGGDSTFCVPAGSMELLQPRQQRSQHAGGTGAGAGAHPATGSYWSGGPSAFNASIPRDVGDRARAEVATAHQRVAAVRASVQLFVGACPGAMSVWHDAGAAQRRQMLEDAHQTWVVEHNPVCTKDDIDTDVLVFVTVGDLRPCGYAGAGLMRFVQDTMALCPLPDLRAKAQGPLLAERVAGEDDALLQLLRAVAGGEDDERTGRAGYEVRVELLTEGRARGVPIEAVPPLFVAMPGEREVTREERRAADVALLSALRELNLTTWAASLCGVLISHAQLTKGARVRVRGLQSRAALNGAEGVVVERAAAVRGCMPRWRVDVGGEVVAVKAANIEALAA